MAEHDEGPPRSFPEPFLRAFREATQRLGWQVMGWRRNDVECLDAQGKEQTVGLHNLFLRAQKIDPEEWPEFVTDFLQRVDVHQFEGMSERPLGEVSGQLLVRVGQPFAERRQGMAVWEQPLGNTGLVVNLVVDYPQAMAYVNADQVEASGQPGSYWLDLALENLYQRTPPDAIQTVDEQTGLCVCEVGDSYESSRSLILDRLLPSASGGYLVSLPHRDLLFAMPVEMRGLNQVHLLKMLANKYFEDAPYAISDEVYWVHWGEWRLFPIEMSETNVNVIPPPEFVEVMNELASEEGEQAEEDQPGDS